MQTVQMKLLFVAGNSTQIEFESSASFDSMQSRAFVDSAGVVCAGKEFLASAGGSDRSGFPGPMDD